MTGNSAPSSKMMHTSIVNSADFQGPDKFEHVEIGTEPGRRDAVLAAHMDDTFTENF